MQLITSNKTAHRTIWVGAPLHFQAEPAVSCRHIPVMWAASHTSSTYRQTLAS